MEAHYLHPPELRMFEGKKGYLTDAVVVIVLGVISSAAWNGIKLLLPARKTRQMKVTFGRREDADGGSITWWQSEGPAESVVESIDHLLASNRSLNRGDPRQIRAEDDWVGTNGRGRSQTTAVDTSLAVAVVKRAKPPH